MSALKGCTVQQSAFIQSTLQAVLLVGAGLLWWQWPVAELPPGFLWPIGATLAAPHKKLFSGSAYIAVIPWLLLCSRATRAWLQVALDTSGFLGTL
jgi:hypothetical protein